MKAPRVARFSLALYFVALALHHVPLVADEGRAATEYNDADSEQPAVFAKIPEKARTRANPLVNDPDAVAAGKKLFVQHCAECHGQEGRGAPKAPSLRSGPIRTATPGMLFWILSNGVVRSGMPVWSKLPEPQRWQVVSYIKSLSPLTFEGQAKAVKKDSAAKNATDH